MVNVKKVGIIGCGFVGSSIAFTLVQSQIFSEMVLIDNNVAKAEGEAMDLSHGLAYKGTMNIYFIILKQERLRNEWSFFQIS